MFNYYLRLAWISILRHWGLSLLMVSAIGLGIGAAITTVTVNYLMSSNPIPEQSEQLFYVQLDSWDVNDPFDDGLNPPDQLTYTDATNLMRAKQAFRQSVQAQAFAVIEPTDPDMLPLIVNARANTADFFTMFNVPFLYGNPWSQASDDNKEHVVVLSKASNEKLFGGENSVGQSIKLAGNMYRVVGVIDNWQPKPRFYDITTGAFNDTEDIFVPFHLIADEKISRSGNTNCWKPTGDGFQAFLASECIWTQFWVQLNSAQEKAEYMQFLNAYVQEQQQLGRFQRPIDNRLSNVMQWLASQEVVADDAQMMMAMSFMFLMVCLLNTVGLLLAKFLGKAPEIGLRQALGASKRTLFYQYIIESACIGIIGGILGLILAYFGLQGIELLYGDAMKDLATLDSKMAGLAVVLALFSSILAGLYPTWRACHIQPAQQLKSQ
ncbi:putative ABC transport system permease protein [Colwellia chukchiensis]|uniref:Putative ABC transport system permease protein n=1 Tax=Colwellia chukchiensis TaxID=641665 RepID=A0A1H7GH40_9GAMM|nr:ABC transporter permease [Colwellia chukchiensis]SEK36847.1 putative ABC transport system permease protein [Colwellia chukchiensis]